MAQQRTSRRRTFGITLVAMLVAAGCGGAPVEETPPADAPVTPPVATTPGSTVADPNAPATGDAGLGAGAVDPVTGLPSSGATAETATIPDLDGGGLGGGLASVSGTSGFAPLAVGGGELAQGASEQTATTPATTPTTQTQTTATVEYSGAVILVDGKTYSVTEGGSFPKGSPVFKLVNVSGADIEVELLAGEFTSGGGDGLFLDKGDMVSLVNSSEQVTYKVKYLRPISDSSADISF